MTDLIFTNAVIPDVDAAGTHDLLVGGGRITGIDNGSMAHGDTVVVNCRGLTMLPGAIDMHVHFRDPGAIHKEDLASGSCAAVSGGVTTVADMPNNTPPITTADAFLAKAVAADDNAVCDVRLFMGLTSDNLREIMTVSSHPRFAGVKVFLGATTGSLLCDIHTVRRACSELDCLFAFHAESNAVLLRAAASHGPGRSAVDHLAMRPVDAAVDGVAAIASMYRPGMRFHVCHVSTAAELDIIKATPGMTCEAAPHHLAFNSDLTGPAGDFAKMNPPLRLESDRAAVMEAVIDGRVDCLATDHAPHTIQEKTRPWPSAPAGVPGVETLVPWTLSKVQDGTMTLDRATALLCRNPAAILGLSDRGAIRPGMRADIVLWDMESTWNVRREDIRSKCGWSLFEGTRLAGRPIHVYVGGKQVYSRPMP